MLQALFDGLFAGSIYALVALALTVTYQPTRIMNFAQGEAFILGAGAGFLFLGINRWNFVVGVLLMIFLAIVMGFLQERMIILPVQLSKSRFAWIIATLAAALIFQAIFSIRFVGDTLSFNPLIDKSFQFGKAIISMQMIISILTSLFIVLAYDQFLRRSIHGRAMRATAHNADTAIILGIPTKRIVVGAFVASSVIGAIAGFLWSPELGVNPASGLNFTISGFIAAIIGGVGSPRGALLGGLIVGLLNTLANNIFGGIAANIAVFIALGLILVVRPAGFFGKPVGAH